MGLSKLTTTVGPKSSTSTRSGKMKPAHAFVRGYHQGQLDMSDMSTREGKRKGKGQRTAHEISLVHAFVMGYHQGGLDAAQRFQAKGSAMLGKVAAGTAKALAQKDAVRLKTPKEAFQAGYAARYNTVAKIARHVKKLTVENAISEAELTSAMHRAEL